jgi:hypothetical protein
MSETPVAVRPGRAKLSTMPTSTGFPLMTNTTGMVGLIATAAPIAIPFAIMTVGHVSPVSAASTLARSGEKSAHFVSSVKSRFC